ncbi:hypothetical protein ACTD5D_32870 [Nocardia takedensis]|uniref:hypothetical protein n=1 Tax=Nocardia takedensis TaxID=259390 RepID=UPI0002ED32F1|nr:hypothetical protein [Nocardia takedensis]
MIPSNATVAEATALLGDRAALPVQLARAKSGAPVAAELIGSFASNSTASTEDPVRDHLAPALPVVGVTESIDAARERLGEYRGSVVVVRAGIGIASIEAGQLADPSERDARPTPSI